MKEYTVCYMINHKIYKMTVTADCENGAIEQLNNVLKAMKVSFVVYGAEEKV